MEIWRPVIGYEGWYSVSDAGRIRREAKGTSTWSGRILKPALTHDGYLRVGLCRGSHASLRFFKVHRLVAQAFLDACVSAHHINHINGIKTDNFIANLEWATPLENSRHASRIGLLAAGDRAGRRIYPERWPTGDQHHARARPEVLARGERNGNSRLTEAAVRDILTSPLTGVAIAAKYGVAKSLISQIRKRQIWQHVVV